MRELQPLRLPQIVEARKLQEAYADGPAMQASPMDETAQSSTLSSQSELPSPASPTSLRSKNKFCSTSSTNCDPLDVTMPAKRPLTEVKEELGSEDELEEMREEGAELYRKRKAAPNMLFYVCDVKLSQHLVIYILLPSKVSLRISPR